MTRVELTGPVLTSPTWPTPHARPKIEKLPTRMKWPKRPALQPLLAGPALLVLLALLAVSGVAAAQQPKADAAVPADRVLLSDPEAKDAAEANAPVRPRARTLSSDRAKSPLRAKSPSAAGAAATTQPLIIPEIRLPVNIPLNVPGVGTAGATSTGAAATAAPASVGTAGSSASTGSSAAKPVPSSQLPASHHTALAPFTDNSLSSQPLTDSLREGSLPVDESVDKWAKPPGPSHPRMRRRSVGHEGFEAVTRLLDETAVVPSVASPAVGSESVPNKRSLAKQLESFALSFRADGEKEPRAARPSTLSDPLSAAAQRAHPAAAAPEVPVHRMSGDSERSEVESNYSGQLSTLGSNGALGPLASKSHRAAYRPLLSAASFAEPGSVGEQPRPAEEGMRASRSAIPVETIPPDSVLPVPHVVKSLMREDSFSVNPNVQTKIDEMGASLEVSPRHFCFENASSKRELSYFFNFVVTGSAISLLMFVMLTFIRRLLRFTMLTSPGRRTPSLCDSATRS